MHKDYRHLDIFGASKGWDANDWTSSDDRVRGGQSQSHLTCNSNKATFFGTLDTKTLGGAGFASQRTASDTATWDLSAFDGIELQVDAKHSDDKQYTLIFKDHLPDSDRRDAREQSSLSWEADFAVRCTSRSAADHDDLVSVFLPWEDFKPTYRGKEQKSKHGPALGSIKRVSIMMRSFFGKQQGAFRLTIVSIRAIESASKASRDQFVTRSRRPMIQADTSSSTESLKKEYRDMEKPRAQASIWHWLLGKCGKL